MKPIRLLGLLIVPQKMMCSCRYLAFHNYRNTPNKYSCVSAVRTSTEQAFRDKQKSKSRLYI